MNRIKGSLLAGLIAFFCIVLVINVALYETVLNMSLLSGLVIGTALGLYFSRMTMQGLAVTFCMICLSGGCLALMIPDYTYSEATALVGLTKPGVLAVHEQKKIPGDYDEFSLIRPAWHYHISMKMEDKLVSYRVNPVTGDITQLSND
ncbi:MraY family glycosyltransferase [Jeotgalibacillus campisalis]|uniref:Uncharacterized protein n=1 Tax=Jeotgalibacillus campisalis TaxID=220754 RepID=A0A0C2VQ61_9BACL|nr:hypothetical protein [Jeotgalibacillus campisalis]KIL51032.1 hypothetical protein KR50_09130 [Jeotgalibacillus campisalis]